jgi:hypothetical protein
MTGSCGTAAWDNSNTRGKHFDLAEFELFSRHFFLMGFDVQDIPIWCHLSPNIHSECTQAPDSLPEFFREK